MSTNKNLMRLASNATKQAAKFISSTERPPSTEWDHKGQSDFATRVDRDAEEIIREVLLKAEPDSIVVGEELSPTVKKSDLSWIVDPLDGTTNYLHGFPCYAVSIAAVAGDDILAGAVFDITRNMLFETFKGGGAWSGETRLQVSNNTEPSFSLIGTGFPFKVPEKIPAYTKQLGRILQKTSGVRRAGAAALDLVHTASGAFDGFWELSLAPWDVAAGTLLVREAGGVVSDLEGSPDVIKHGSVVAGNPHIHSWLSGVLREAS
jgi:myo-inositol-1(or 4)-monophosphatase